MEFETNTTTDSSQDISDDQRLAAQARTRTIQPLNPFLATAPAAAVTVNEDQANVSTDSEDTSEPTSLLRPSAPSDDSTKQEQGSAQAHKQIVVSATIIVTTLAAGAVLLIVS